LLLDGTPGSAGFTDEKFAELTAVYEVIALYIEPDMTDLKKTASTMFFFGIGVFFVAGGMMTFWGLFGESIAFKVRINYFRKCLEKDAAFYDVNVPTAMSSKISKETAAIQRGLSDKIATFIYGISTFFLGLGFSFFYGWFFTCILLVSIPVMAMVGVLIGSIMESGMVEAMKAYS
jgi:ATP-binding cassette subfamily B (MDR/TAP) protein 1